MPTQVIMPQFGESVVEGAVARWLIREGQPVQRDEPLLQVTTDKVDTEVPAPASGMLLKIYVSEGQTVPKGTVLAEIGEADDGRWTSAEPPHGMDDSGHTSGGSPSITPVAQRMAAEHGIDLAEITGTGPGGRITREDVEAHLAFSEGEVATQPSASQSTDLSTTSLPASNLAFISPVVARLAGELGVDLTQVIGTGGGGRITKKDVLAYVAAPVPRDVPFPSRPDGPDRETLIMLNGSAAQGASQRVVSDHTASLWEASQPSTRLFADAMSSSMLNRQPAQSDTEGVSGQGGVALDGSLAAVETPAVASGSQPGPPPAAGDYDIVPLSIMRRAIAEHMALSVRTAPHVTTVMEADMTRVVRARERMTGEFERQGVRLTFTPFLVQAVVTGLKAVPRANSSFREDALLLYRRIHVGLAVALPDGLIVPVIRDADEKSLLGLARAVNDLAGRSRAKQLKPEETQGGTFTLTNHGTSGSLFANPIIVQPQAGILGVGAIRKRLVVVGGGHPLLPDAQDAIAIRPMAYLSFTFDHRVLNGQEADSFLEAVVRFLEGYAE